MTKQDLEILKDYVEACTELNRIAEAIAVGKTETGTFIMPADVGPDYYDVMRACDRYVSYFAAKGLDVDKLVDEHYPGGIK